MTSEEKSGLKRQAYEKLAEAKELLRCGEIEDGISITEQVVHKLLDVITNLNKAISDYDCDSQHSNANMKSSAISPSAGEDTNLSKALDACIQTELPLKDWNEVIGQDEAKKALMEAVEYPLKYPWLFQNKINPPKGVLLYGPPGVAKTHLALIAASMSGAALVTLRGSDIKSKWLGDSERFVKAMFQRIKQLKKAVIFIDEVDSILKSRDGQSNDSMDGTVNEFLVELNENQLPGVWFVLIGATNYPEKIDVAMRSRFQHSIRLQMPTDSEKAKMYNMFLSNCGYQFQQTDYFHFASQSKGFTGRDIKAVTTNAVLQCFREAKKENESITEEDFLKVSMTTVDVKTAIRKHTRTVSDAILNKLDSFQKISKTSVPHPSRKRDAWESYRKKF